MQDQWEATIQDLLDSGAANNGDDKFLAGLTILEKLGSNVFENLDEAKYRTIKKGNPALQKKLFSLPQAQSLLALMGFTELGEVFLLNDSEIDKLFKSLPLIIFKKRLIEAKKEGPEAYAEEQEIIKRQKINSKKQQQDALAKKNLQKALDCDKQERLKMEISYAKSRPLGFASEKKADGHQFLHYLNKMDDFEKAKSSKVPVVIDFYADWCPPCKKLLPIMEERLAADKGKWHLYKANCDNKEIAPLAASFKVKGIPHLVLMKGGKVVYSQSGGMSKQDFGDLIETYFS